MHRSWPLDKFATTRAGIAVLALLAVDASAQYAVSQSPPMSVSPPTNIALTLDDSGSMKWAYVPDAFGACTGTRRFNAADFNGLAYNPKTAYYPPTVITSVAYSPSNAVTDPVSGATTLTTSYTAAYIDGFNPGLGSINLTNGYQPTASYQPNGTQIYSPHPAQDLATIGVTSASGGGGNSGVNPSCGSSVYGGANGSSGAGNQFGPYSGSSTAVPAAAYYYVYNSTLSSCPTPPATSPSLNDDGCYQYMPASSAPDVVDQKTGKTLITGQQNFANWYSFYRTRHLMVASAGATAFYDQRLMGARVTWRALNSCQDMVSGKNCAGWDKYPVDNRLRTFNDTPVATGKPGQRGAFYEWLAHLQADQSTPTRSTWTYIGDYFSQGPNSAFTGTSLGPNGPYGLNPNQPNTDLSSGEVACVNNYNITLTDGQWNGDSSTTGAYFGTADATAIPKLPDGTPYVPSTKPPTAIYSNDSVTTGASPYANSDTLSDIAFHYWSTNLRPDLPGSVGAVTPYYVPGAANPPTTNDYWNPQNDPANWPHLVQMTIGVGMTGSMTAPNLPWWGNDVRTQYGMPGYLNLYNGNPYPWPMINNSATQGDLGKAYDLWHAALNSRGLAFSAESAADLINAVGAAIARASVTLIAQSAVATSSTSLSNSTAAYLASFTSADWHGTLAAYGFTNNVLNSPPNWIWNTDHGALFAASTTPANRSIFTANNLPASSAGQASTTGLQFSTADSTFMGIWNAYTGGGSTATAAAQQASIDRLNWVRGDQTKESRFTPTGIYRDRKASVLGDIVDSSPVFTLQENFGYAALPEGGNYLTFLSGKNLPAGSIYQGKGMIYVGANDGMLHGFDANSGNEVFAYVPHNVIANVPGLADPTYVHRFYVDQTPYVGDACLHGSGANNSGCTWSTVLVGTTGAGGQGVFALDVTHPATMESASNAVGNLLWDLDGLGAPTTNPTNGYGNPDLGYPIGKPMVARLNDGTWAAIFGNGYLSADGCAVLFIVRLDSGAVSRLGTSTSTAPGSSCVASPNNPNASNGLGPVTLYDSDGNMTTDYVYAGDLGGNLWKFDLTASHVPAPGTDASAAGQLLFAASPNCFAPAPPATGTNTCQPITSAPALGPALTGLSGTMVYFGTGRIFAIGDLASTVQQVFYAVLDKNDGATVPVSKLEQEKITETGTTRTVSNTSVKPTDLGWYMNFFDSGERLVVSPVVIGGYVVFATDVPSTTPCTVTGSGWIMAVSANSAPGGQNNFFAGTGGVNGIQVQSNVGVVEGITVLSSPGGPDTLLVGGTKGVQSVQTNVKPLKGRISWHELVR
jgi:type IV pilus assembly protein PilY1